MRCTPEGGGWGNGDGHPDYTVYFYAQFSRPLKQYGYWKADIPGDAPRRLGDVTSEATQKQIAEAQLYFCGEGAGKHIGFFSEFETKENEEIVLKAAISFVDMEGAEKNFNAEIANRSFDEVYGEAQKQWDKALSKIIVTGGSEDEKTVFYTALYHTMIDPRIFSDVDGRYWGGDKQIHVSDKFTKRTIFSGWDVFRSQFPLQTIIHPQLVNDQINSLITLAEENGTGYLERWEFLNAYSGCMIGNPAISIIADAYRKGIHDYNVEKAWQYALRTSEKFGNGETGYSFPYGISSTLEYAYSDWCMSVLAKELGKEADAHRFFERSKAYKQVFDRGKGWFRPRTPDGNWEEWPENGRTQEWYGCIESNPYQQGWFVPHDVPGMVELMGGEEKALADLTEFFEKTPADLLWNQYYNHANEPVHHVPFLFNRLNMPGLTQKWTRYICRNAYKNEVEGLVGNEDAGQMSAWYVLAASGIHPVCPGDVRYEITAPLFDEIRFHLDSGKTFTITVKNNSSGNGYIQSIELNGNAHKQYAINHEDITGGGTLVLNMTD
jgi:predicted alpha-1,2-mannosidase